MSYFLQQKNEIDEWLRVHDVSDYTIIKNPEQNSHEYAPWVVDTFWEVDLSKLNLSSIPVKFNHVAGNFLCSMNDLTSLIFAPKTVGGYFSCSHNRLTTLEFAPQIVGQDFYCHRNQLTSLKGVPNKIQGGFNCMGNWLTTLEFTPQWVKEDFNCIGNQLNTLDFCPEYVGTKFMCGDNPDLKDYQTLTTLKEILIKKEAAFLQKSLNPMSKNSDKDLLMSPIFKL